MRIANQNPLAGIIGLQPCSMDLDSGHRTSLLNLVESTIGPSIPYHVPDIERIDHNGADGGIAPFSAVDAGPRVVGIVRLRDNLGVEDAKVLFFRGYKLLRSGVRFGEPRLITRVCDRAPSLTAWRGTAF
jgi:hypothetical protein